MTSKDQYLAVRQAMDINPKVNLERGNAVAFVEMADLDENVTRVRSAKSKVFTGSGAKFCHGDTLFARITPCLENGKIAKFIADEGVCGFGSTEFIVFRGRADLTTSDFVHYACLDPEFRAYAISKMTGSSGRQRVPIEAFDHLRIRVPTIPEQDVITKTLGNLDDKLELLRAMNVTLENILKSMFQAWFGDFEPVRAKSNGKTAFKGMPKKIFAALPSAFSVEPYIGAIPNGWKTERLIDLAEWVNGAAYKNMHFSDAPDALPVVKIAELKSGVTPNTKFTNTKLGDKFQIFTGDLMFSWSGSPETSINAFIWALGDAWLNQHIFVVRPNGKATRGFLFALLKFLMPSLISIAKNKQTTGLGHVTRADMQRIRVCVPSQEVMTWFGDFADEIYSKMLANLVEMHTVTQLRNSLLPRLMSGDLRLPAKPLGRRS